MASEIIINVEPWETRVALMENGTLVEFYVEREAERGYVGNIYKGKVVRVLPGMQAAFVEIGLPRTAFLYVTDIYDHLHEFEFMLEDGEFDDLAGEMQYEDQAYKKAHPLYHEAQPFRIEELLHKGQELLVQVSRCPVGTKGARVTSHISLPGRYLVLMPTMDHVGVSRRIKDEKERHRLKDLVEALCPKGPGFIVRTAGEGASAVDIQSEMEFLVKLWANIQRKAATTKVPGLLYEDLDITLRAVRDLFTSDAKRLVVDSEAAYSRIVEFVDTFCHDLRPRVEYYDYPQPIFDAFGIEAKLSKLFSKKVWLKSGGYIVIETTEALTAIDVNTGKYVGRRHQEDTILKTNLEAVKEIAYRLRLRNIGGIIIIDFIDMEEPEHKIEVFKALSKAVGNDKCKTNILEMSEIGLIQMTRKRNRETLSRIISEPCFYCEGSGFLRSRRTIAYEIFRKVKDEAKWSNCSGIEIYVHPRVGDLMLNHEAHHIEYLEERFKRSITVVPRSELHIEQYEIVYKP